MRRRRDGFGEIDWSRVDWRELAGLRTPREPPGRGVSLAVAVVVALLVFVFLAGPLVRFWTDLIWFRSVGYEDIFLLRYYAGFAAFAAFFLLFFAFAAVNVALALRPQVVPRVVEVGERPALMTPRRVALLLLVPSFFFGLAAAGQWDDLLRFLNATPFGRADPLFGQDVSFYFFTLPVLAFLRDWAMLALTVAAAAVLAAYLARGAFDVARGGFEGVRGGARALLGLAAPVRVHLSVLGAVFLLLVAYGYQLDRYELLFREEAVLTGAGFTSVHARVPALTVLSVIAVVSAALLLANAWARTLWLLGGTLGVWLVASILLGGVYPALVERFLVQPAQQEREREFIARHIAATRAAYGIDQAEETSFDVKDQPTPEDVRRDLAAVENVRVWDYRPLRQTLGQIQSIRAYYEFPDVDVTRVTVDGKPQQIMIAARELNVARIPQTTWVNVHLRFTHGYGAAATPVSAVTAEGLPALSLKDLPPQGVPRVDRPQLYFGELTRMYVIVGTSEDEFDHPKENVDETTRFDAATGIPIGGFAERVLFATRFGELNLLFTPQLTSNSRLLMHREVRARAQLVAPFLLYDHDPYLAVAGGKLFWIHDAYTTGDRYPYAEALGHRQLRGAEGLAFPDLRYLRNSVKIVTDAYDGTLTFYLADPDDPVVRTLARIYPNLFRPLSDMPRDLRAQLRYPEDLFRIQTSIYGRYHVTDPTAFYNGSDQWQVANEVLAQGGPVHPMEPYYVITRLPGADQPEFLLFVPMTPVGRDNMIAWFAGRSDEPNYGKLRALRFATDRAIFGPLQIEARIDQDPVIKTQLALLSQAGTEVERGNLLVIPVGSSFIYVEPIFIKAKAGSIPELRRVVLATQARVVMAETLPQALAQLIGAVATPIPIPQTPTTAPTGVAPPPQALTPQIRDLVRSASEHYEKALAALRAGDFATYGAELKALEQDLARLRDLTGVQ